LVSELPFESDSTDNMIKITTLEAQQLSDGNRSTFLAGEGVIFQKPFLGRIKEQGEVDQIRIVGEEEENLLGNSRLSTTNEPARNGVVR
jgi:hypothetical protein